MGKSLKRIAACALVALTIWSIGVVRDKQELRKNLIRLHVVAASDSESDQALKLQVRDAVISALQDDIRNLTDAKQAKAYLQDNLPKIEALANHVLLENGSSDKTTVSLQQEAFATRYYDTFTLPAGVYNALRIVIGDGQGKNWWCVVFPSLCLPAASETFADTATGAGFPETLNCVLTGETRYELRFAVLDALGEL